MQTTFYKPGKEYRIEIPEEPIFSLDTNTFHIGYNLPKIKSHIKIGNLIFHNTKHFNWFHRMMWKLFFGFEIENIEVNNDE